MLGEQALESLDEELRNLVLPKQEDVLAIMAKYLHVAYLAIPTPEIQNQKLRAQYKKRNLELFMNIFKPFETETEVLEYELFSRDPYWLAIGEKKKRAYELT